MKKCKIKFRDIGINEILKIVEIINSEIEDQCEDSGSIHRCRPLSFKCDGHMGNGYFNNAWINFFNLLIWHSEEYEDKNEYESLEVYLRREIREIINTISKIKV